jgi:hypothetical protein
VPLSFRITRTSCEAREWFVQQQQARPRRQRAGQCDTLLLAARQLVRRTLGGMAQAHQVQHLLHALSARAALEAGDAEGHVVGHAEVGEERVVLEHHADLALLGGQVHTTGGIRQHFAADGDAAGGAAFQPGHRAQQRGLAAARRADQDPDLTALQAQADAVDGGAGGGGARVADGHGFQAQEHEGIIIRQTE